MDLLRKSEQVTSPWFFLPDNKLSIVHLNIEGLLGQARHKNGARPTDTQRKIDFLMYSVQYENSPSLLSWGNVLMTAKYLCTAIQFIDVTNEVEV